MRLSKFTELGLVFILVGTACQAAGRKSLSVEKICGGTLPAAEQVVSIMDSCGVASHEIGCVDWKEYPYKPKVSFRIAHTGTAILLQYNVSEESIRAEADKDNGHVWEDSCVEFFLSPSNDDFYYNFECSCIGKVLLAGGEKGGKRLAADSSVLKLVRRWSSLGSGTFSSRTGGFEWTATLVIPVEALYLNDIESLDGKRMKGNFYKCGDRLPTPHYLSWNRVRTPKPQFHSPEYFGKLKFRR